MIGPVDNDGYYAVRLDHPAVYHHPDGHTEELPEIIEYYDNLVLLAPDQ